MAPESETDKVEKTNRESRFAWDESDLEEVTEPQDEGDDHEDEI